MRRFFIAIAMAAASLGAYAFSPVLNVAYQAMSTNNLEQAQKICYQSSLNGVEVMETNIIYYIDDAEDMLGLVTTTDGETLTQIDTYVKDKAKDVQKQLLNMGFKETVSSGQSYIETRNGKKMLLKGIYEKGDVKCTLFNGKEGVTAVFTRI